MACLPPLAWAKRQAQIWGKPEVELPKRNWLKAAEPLYVVAASLLLFLAIKHVTIVPCGKGELAIIGKPVEVVLESVGGCDCCGHDVLVAEAPE